MNKRNGAFIHEGEQFAVNKIGDGSEYEGMFEVVDSEGFQISVAFTKKLAVQNALEEIEYIAWHLDNFLADMFGESA